ncbi:calcium uniporter protein 3, mitochondrial-like [Bidens hawaiensis]|uniref:calcium uniporter protein 3, mitochondrial-like n=1 Tax=Bidens hawaiensis TaxID=980011 RepID=UPI0040499BAF
MAIKQTLINRIFNNIRNTNFSNQTLRNCRISSASTTTATPFRPVLERLKEMDITRGWIRLDVLSPPQDINTYPAALRSPMEKNTSERRSSPAEITLADAKKILRVSQIEKLKCKLSNGRQDHVTYDKFVEICVDGCSSRDQGLDLAKALDDSGSVIVLGNVVFLKPHQVVKAIYGLLPPNSPATHNSLVKELEEMERWKAAIDTKAKKMVQRELWGGLAYLMVQTAGFMRLTFWELSWDVMEPICFYVTSIYFMGGYAFFLRTAKEPSFEGFFQSRFGAKQKKLMKREGFDFGKYNELRKACYPRHEAWPSETLVLKSRFA